MSYTEANIVPLEDEDKNLVYPPTVYQAVFNPETGGTLDQEMITSAEEESITDTIPRDADTLGGHTPDYFATNDSLNGKADASKVTKNQIDDYLSVSGGTCVLELNSVLGTNFTNYTIPQAYRPSHTIYAPAFVTVGNIRYMGFLGVNPNGALSGYYFTAYASNTSANILGTNYIVANISWNV